MFEVSADAYGRFMGRYSSPLAPLFLDAVGAPAQGRALDVGQQLQIVLTAALASIGTAAVPGVGIVMLVIVLRQVHIPEAGIALILAVDRPLDMCRTVLNVTGDATVATVVASSEGLIHEGKRHHAPTANADGTADPTRET